MTKKIVLGASALLLGVVGVFAGRASAKFASSPAYASLAGVCTQLSSNTSFFTTSSSLGTTKASINTANGTLVPIYSNVACTHRVYFKH
jgi:hypothetical protein